MGEGGGLERPKPAEREKRYIGDPIVGQAVDQPIVASIGQVVAVLHADDVADPPSGRDLGWSHVAQSDVSHESLPLQVREDGESRVDQLAGTISVVENVAKIDDSPIRGPSAVLASDWFRSSQGRWNSRECRVLAPPSRVAASCR